MSGFQEWVASFQGPIQTIGNTIIVVVALVFISFMIVKAIASFKGSKMTDGFKFVGFAVIIAIIAALGVGGITALMGTLTEGSENMFTFDNNSFRS